MKGLGGLAGPSSVLVAYIFAVVLTVQAAPVLVAVADAVLPVILVAGGVIALLRLLFVYTRRW